MATLVTQDYINAYLNALPSGRGVCALEAADILAILPGASSVVVDKLCDDLRGLVTTHPLLATWTPCWRKLEPIGCPCYHPDLIALEYGSPTLSKIERPRESIASDYMTCEELALFLEEESAQVK